jgi:hypothetical protein
MRARREVVVRKLASGETSDLDRDVLRMTPAERVLLAWELSLEASSLAATNAAVQPRLQRSALVLYRR